MRLGYLSRRAGALELLSSRFVGSGAEAWKAKMSASIFPTPAPHGEEKEAQEPLWGAKIVAVRDLLAGRRASGSREGAVRLLKLRVGDEPKDSGGSKLQGCGLRYSGGQWVDMFIPGIKQIGGEGFEDSPVWLPVAVPRRSPRFCRKQPIKLPTRIPDAKKTQDSVPRQPAFSLLPPKSLGPSNTTLKRPTPLSPSIWSLNLGPPLKAPTAPRHAGNTITSCPDTQDTPSLLARISP